MNSQTDRAARVSPAPVKRFHRHDVDGEETSPRPSALALAKARVGAALRKAIGVRPLKAYGHEGLLNAVCSGEKAPEYLARIYEDRDARRRLALALLEDDSGVVVTTTITMPLERAS